ncbi:MAG TPA: hypothetical protein VGR07_04940, partial [Thermoanaerobaculia bacterium]|nr:hypothetical protein [Thermoanaerobaculia bacterium]
MLVSLLLALLALAPPAQGQVASLARDINSGPADLSPGDLGGPSSWLVAAGNRVYFPDRTDSSGTELWTSDGTAFGTVQVADLCPGPCSGQPRPLGILGNVLLFTAEAPRRLWRTDGTPAGTYRLSPEGTDEQPRAFLGGKAFFQLCPAHAPSCELWATDGTAAGTRKLAAVGGEVVDLAAAGAKVFALSAVAGGGATLWASDGTPAGTALVAPVAPDSHYLLPAGNRVVVWAGSGPASEIWGSDGTTAGTGRLRQFGPDASARLGAFLGTSLGGQVYFTAIELTSGVQIWASDGTASGTVRVTGLGGFVPALLASQSNALLLGGRLLFEAVDEVGRARLFATAGTPASTVQLSSAIVLGPLAKVGGIGGRAVYLADDGVHGVEPWTSDGTPAGTALLADTCPGACGVLADPPLQPLSGLAFFLSGDPEKGDDLWVTDGTAAGTRRYTDFGASRPVVGAQLAATAAAGGKVFFAATDPEHGGELWVSDGRGGGTRRVTDIGRRHPSSDPAEPTALGNRLLFTACDGVNRGVWASDGSPAGTVPLPTSGSASPCADAQNHPRSLTAAAGAVYFLAGSGPGLALWRTDGNSAGAG